MRKFWLLIGLLLVILSTVTGISQAANNAYAVKKFSGEENVYTINNFKMPQLDRKRRVWIYLPPNYHKTDQRYPVLYMQDGQNLFTDKARYGSWKVDEAIDKLYKQGKTKGAIVVAVDHGGDLRGREYGYISSYRAFDPQGEKYAQFLVNTLKPYIDKHYRTLPGREHTAILGSSLGARISLYIGFDYPQVFSQVGAFSVSGFDPFVFKEKIRFKEDYKMKIYFDIGTDEYQDWQEERRGEEVANMKEIYDLFTSMGLKDEEVTLLIDKGAAHNEKNWARRFPAVFLWLVENKDITFEQYISQIKTY